MALDDCGTTPWTANQVVELDIFAISGFAFCNQWRGASDTQKIADCKKTLKNRDFLTENLEKTGNQE